MIQTLWQLRVNWDDPVPKNLMVVWSALVNDIKSINHIQIPRHVLLEQSDEICLHGFCDTSEKAYGAAIYVSSRSSHSIKTSLLCAKSKVAPIKSLSLPRLELCGALLLAKLMRKVTSSLTVKINKTFYWTDSTIVLSWLSAEPQTWQTFISNRVSEIQQISITHNWYHIRSADNPADIISRGMSVAEITTCRLWWQGPTFLSFPIDNWPQHRNISHFARNSSGAPERRRNALTLNCLNSDDVFINSLFHKYSSFSKLRRVVAFCLRFVNNARCSIIKNRNFGLLNGLRFKTKLSNYYTTCSNSNFF